MSGVAQQLPGHLYKQCGKLVNVCQICPVESLHLRLNAGVKIVEPLYFAGLSTFRQIGKIVDLVIFCERPDDMQIEPETDPLLFQRFYPEIKLALRLRGQFYGVIVRIFENVWLDPFRVMTMDSHQIETELRYAPGMFLDIVIAGPEQGSGLKIGAPESGGSAIGEDEFSTSHLDKTERAVSVPVKSIPRSGTRPVKLAREAPCRYKG